MRTPIYMHFDGIDGTVLRKKRKWIELESCQFGPRRNVTSNTGTSPNQDSRVPAVSEMVVTKRSDASSPVLFRASLMGVGKSVVIHFVEAGEHVTEKDAYMILELENAMISSYTVSGGEGGQRPMETLSLNFTKSQFTNPAIGTWHTFTYRLQESGSGKR